MKILCVFLWCRVYLFLWHTQVNERGRYFMVPLNCWLYISKGLLTDKKRMCQLFFVVKDLFLLGEHRRFKMAIFRFAVKLNMVFYLQLSDSPCRSTYFQNGNAEQLFSAWWFQKLLIFTLLGEMIQFDQYFSDGLKPPTNCISSMTFTVMFTSIGNFLCCGGWRRCLSIDFPKKINWNDSRFKEHTVYF